METVISDTNIFIDLWNNRILIQFHLQPNAIIWLIKYYLGIYLCLKSFLNSLQKTMQIH